jgi:large subunit ribosomal protein L54
VCVRERRGDTVLIRDAAKSKKQRRLAAKRLRKEQAMNPELLTPKVPIYEQTIDLPSGDGSLAGAVEAAGARGELTKAMRDKRRASIKEANFLKAMG